MEDNDAWAKGINASVERVLLKHGVKDFLLVAVRGEGVVIGGSICDGCMTEALAGGVLAFPRLRQLLCDALALAMSHEQSETVCLLH